MLLHNLTQGGYGGLQIFSILFMNDTLYTTVCNVLEVIFATKPPGLGLNIHHIFLTVVPLITLQMKGQWESNINVWFPFMYSQKWNCAALLLSKQNYNVLSSSSYTHISVRDLYISRIGLSLLLQPNTVLYVDSYWGIHKSLTDTWM